MKKILVIGSLNMDQSIHINEMPLEGQTIMGDELKLAAGGKGANQACAAGKLGADVTMLGCVGRDQFGERLIEGLRLAGVQTAYLKQEDHISTGTAIIYINKMGNNCIVVAPGANTKCDVSYLKDHDTLFRQSDYILLQMEIPYEAVYYAVRRGAELGKKVVLNPAPAPKELEPDIYDKLYLMTPNETELMTLTGMPVSNEREILVAAKELISRGTEHVLVTLGEKGVLLVNKKEAVCYSARKCHAVDTTAAGDTFNAAFLTALAEDRDIEEACRFANLASSIAVTRAGAQDSIPLRQEVLEQMDSFLPSPVIISE